MVKYKLNYQHIKARTFRVINDTRDLVAQYVSTSLSTSCQRTNQGITYKTKLQHKAQTIFTRSNNFIRQ